MIMQVEQTEQLPAALAASGNVALEELPLQRLIGVGGQL
jgi:hypothetical protein